MTSPRNFDHASINIPGVTLPSDPGAAALALEAHVERARRQLGATIPHAEVMADMRERIARAARS
jgi:hypothetical protein